MKSLSNLHWPRHPVFGRGHTSRWPALSRPPWRALRTLLGLGLLGAFVPQDRCNAQHGTGLTEIDGQGVVHIPPLHESMPLTVSPRTLTLGTQTAKGGMFPLDSVPQSLVYVPEQCVGARRCPLVVFLHPAATNPTFVVEQWKPVSDKYGMILLAPASTEYDWQSPGQQEDRRNVDASLSRVLQTCAVDTHRIALIGYSASGGGAIALGGYRLDLFSRIVLGSTDFYIKNVDPRNKTTRFLVTDELTGSRSVFNQVQALRRDGHPVDAVLGLRDHGGQPEDWDFMGRWLMTSWSPSGRGIQPMPRRRASPLPPLTTDAVAKVTLFWTKFMTEPDSIRTAGRLAHLVEVVVPIGTERPSMLIADIEALATQYPGVAAGLAAAGLTAQQYQAYRIALIRARAANFAVHGSLAEGPHPVPRSDIPGFPDLRKAQDSIDRLGSLGKSPVVIEASSVEGENLAFVRAHGKELRALMNADWWLTP